MGVAGVSGAVVHTENRTRIANMRCGKGSEKERAQISSSDFDGAMLIYPTTAGEFFPPNKYAAILIYRRTRWAVCQSCAVWQVCVDWERQNIFVRTKCDIFN